MALRKETKIKRILDIESYVYNNLVDRLLFYLPKSEMLSHETAL